MSPSNHLQERAWLALLVATFGVVTLFILVALLNTDYWPVINFTLNNATGISLNYIAIVIVITCLLEASVVIPIAKYYLRKRRGGDFARPHIINIIALCVVLVAWIYMLEIIALETYGVAWAPFHWFESGAIAFYGILVALIFIISFYITRHPGNNQRKIVAVLLVAQATTACLLLAFPPANVTLGTLPPKPQIIGHRGGYYLGPENTIEVANTSLKYGMVGMEVDVDISADGVPFLMHDDSLARTTNVAEIFPNHTNDAACTFTWAELQQLLVQPNFAGEDPYGTIKAGFVSPGHLAAYKNAHIPSLQAIANFCHDHGLILNVDWKQPPADHPFYSQYYNLCINILAYAGIQAGVWIFNVTSAQIPTNPAPTSKFVFGAEDLDVQAFLASGKQIVNCGDQTPTSTFRAYRDAGIIYNVWAPSTAWRVSQLWCLGANYVTTNAPQILYTLEAPEGAITADLYYSLWTVITLLGVVILFAIFHRIARKNVRES